MPRFDPVWDSSESFLGLRFWPALNRTLLFQSTPDCFLPVTFDLEGIWLGAALTIAIYRFHNHKVPYNQQVINFPPSYAPT